MAAKFFALCLMAALVTPGFCITEITIPDRNVTFITNPLIALTITIPKLFLDTQLACYIIMPNGILHEFYPQLTFEEDPIFVLRAVDPFNACALGFRGAPISYSGTYEMLSHIRHSSDNSESLTRQKFNIIFIESSGKKDEVEES